MEESYDTQFLKQIVLCNFILIFNIRCKVEFIPAIRGTSNEKLILDADHYRMMKHCGIIPTRQNIMERHYKIDEW